MGNFPDFSITESMVLVMWPHSMLIYEIFSTAKMETDNVQT